MVSEGTTKWDMCRFMAIDLEEHEKLEAASTAAQTASVPTAHTRLRHAR